MEQGFFLYDLRTSCSRDFCRKIVEKTARLKLGCGDIQLSHDKNGRPYLEHSEYCVSYSHTNNLLFIALSEYPIGVDFESEKREEELRDVQEIAFSKNDSVSNGALVDSWCLKEASLKKKGIGFLLANPNECTLKTNSNQYELRIKDDLADKGFYKIIKERGYVFAICSVSKITDYKIINEEL